MSEHYILVDGEPRPVDLLTWGKWLQTAERQLARTTVSEGVEVSTVFLGLDHSFGQGPPLIWETMIFGGPHDSYQPRASTLAAAEAQHASAVRLAGTP